MIISESIYYHNIEDLTTLKLKYNIQHFLNCAAVATGSIREMMCGQIIISADANENCLHNFQTYSNLLVHCSIFPLLLKWMISGIVYAIANLSLINHQFQFSGVQLCNLFSN